VAGMMLKVEGLTRRYGARVAVGGISFQINRGECVGLLGPNGAGKTSTLAMLSGIAVPDAGAIRFDVQTAAAQAIKQCVGLVPQDLALFDEISAWANLQLFGGLYGLPARLLRDRADAALELVGLADRRNDLVKTFSGGMKRRLNIAGALLHDPELVLLDEPTVGVDPQSRNAIFENLEALKRRGKTLLYTTHYMEEAERLCERVLIMDQGRILADDSVASLKATHGNLEQAFLRLTGHALRDAAEGAAA
jgi:ABC-2 type transport system ATP-binding protein